VPQITHDKLAVIELYLQLS